MKKSKYSEQRRAERLARRERNKKILLASGIVIFAIAAFFIVQWMIGMLNATEDIDTSFPLSDAAVTTRSGLVYDVLLVGSGPEAKSGDTISVRYTGYLPDGQAFDSNVESGEYLEFVLGAGMVMKGWDEGIKGMQVGGARLLVIPPDLTVGASDPSMTIPANTTLTYSITLMEIK
jgi:FKBP-type peptidyl-prolyl cis-trans isomerase FkpA